MFEWLFPNWSNPDLLTTIVGARIFLNITLVAITARATGRWSLLTVSVAGLALLSAVMTVLLLRLGTLGRRASYVESLVQLAILALSGYAVASNPTLKRLVAFAVVSIGALVLGLVMIPIYGEAFVAP